MGNIKAGGPVQQKIQNKPDNHKTKRENVTFRLPPGRVWLQNTTKWRKKCFLSQEKCLTYYFLFRVYHEFVLTLEEWSSYIDFKHSLNRMIYPYPPSLSCTAQHCSIVGILWNTHNPPKRPLCRALTVWFMLNWLPAFTVRCSRVGRSMLCAVKGLICNAETGNKTKWGRGYK